ncbi:MAG TPA: 5-deoxy-glucuronate isomerase [bacterium]|nr:5-deoxy-glucuronate isomerase [bacterium]HPP30195.1 5-deoxy-glucuronate isomerase [bacterium]
MAKRYKVNDFQGYQKIVSPENSDLKNINLAVVKNSPGERFDGSTESEENVFIIMEGAIKFYLEDKLFGELSREDVFQEPPSAVYLPPYSKYSIEFIKKGEVCIAGCIATGKFKPQLIETRNIRIKRVGEEMFLRNLIEIVPEDFAAEKLIVGETITDPGNWSSYPPHKHDTDNPPEETALEELYFFKIRPETGFGSIRIFNTHEDLIFLVKNEEVITIPKGYHPVCVAPKHELYYLWIMAGNTRKVIPSIHPAYKFNNKNSDRG